MKTLIIAIAGLMVAGCASQKSSDASAVATAACTTCDTTTGVPGTPTGTGVDPTVTGYDSGSTAAMTLNGSALQRLFYISKPSNTTNARINIDLSSQTESVIVSYVQNGVLHEASFGTTHQTAGYPAVQDASYNGWVSQNGSNVWKGFFQDDYGAIVLVVDKTIGQTDGTSASILGGSVWFQNFQQSNIQNPLQGPLKMCWQITAGPYDCRSFLVNKNISMTSSLYPNNYGPDKVTGYEKLGDFAGISATASGF